MIFKPARFIRGIGKLGREWREFLGHVAQRSPQYANLSGIGALVERPDSIGCAIFFRRRPDETPVEDDIQIYVRVNYTFDKYQRFCEAAFGTGYYR